MSAESLVVQKAPQNLWVAYYCWLGEIRVNRAVLTLINNYARVTLEGYTPFHPLIPSRNRDAMYSKEELNGMVSNTHLSAVKFKKQLTKPRKLWVVSYSLFNRNWPSNGCVYCDEYDANCVDRCIRAIASLQPGNLKKHLPRSKDSSGLKQRRRSYRHIPIFFNKAPGNVNKL